MFEIAVISIIVLAVGYWVTLWLMRRHDDVLHGDFVHGEPGEASALSDQPFPTRPPSSTRPPFPARPKTGPAAVKPAAGGVLPAQPASTTAFSERSDTLQTLLASIKRDLKDASKL
jgi:hypothetical protein